MSKGVSSQDLLKVMVKIRDLRAYTVRERLDPWAVRQGLILALELDTAAALERRVPIENLQEFDQAVRADVRTWVGERLKRGD